MIVTRRAVLTWLAVLTAIGAVFGVGMAANYHPVTVATVATTSTPVTAVGPMEDEPGFNPCTMGNLGPCDVSTTLPDGAWFRYDVTPVSLPGVTCNPGLLSVSVDVLAVRGDGTDVRAHQSVTVCARSAGPVLGPDVTDLLPGLFRVVGAQV